MGHVLVGGMLPSGQRLLGRRSSACLPRSSLSAEFLQGGSQVSPTPVPGSQGALGEIFRSEPKWETRADRRVRLTGTTRPASQPRPRHSFAFTLRVPICICYAHTHLEGGLSLVGKVINHPTNVYREPTVCQALFQILDIQRCTKRTHVFTS